MNLFKAFIIFIILLAISLGGIYYVSTEKTEPPVDESSYGQRAEEAGDSDSKILGLMTYIDNRIQSDEPIREAEVKKGPHNESGVSDATISKMVKATNEGKIFLSQYGGIDTALGGFLKYKIEDIERNLLALNTADAKLIREIKRYSPDLFSEYAIGLSLEETSKNMQQVSIVANIAKQIGYVPSNKPRAADDNQVNPSIIYNDSMLSEEEHAKTINSNYKLNPASAKIESGDAFILFDEINKAVIVRGTRIIATIESFSSYSGQY